MLISFLYYDANDIYKKRAINVEKYFLVMIVVNNHCLAVVGLSLKSLEKKIFINHQNKNNWKFVITDISFLLIP